MISEEWRAVVGYEGLYEVSNLGNVRSIARNTTSGKILKNIPDTKGYLHVGLCKEGKKRTYKVHRLVAEAFIPNPDNLPQVNHKNEDKTDNRVENLEYCDSKYNNNYGTHTERVAKARSIPVAQYTKSGILVQTYEGIKEAARRTGSNRGNIIECCKGKLKSCGGFIWKYA